MMDPVAFKTVRYRCPHCHKSYSSKSSAKAHMSRCARDRNNKGCMTCAHDRCVSLSIMTESGPAGTIERLCEAGVREYGKDVVVRCDSWQAKPTTPEARP